MPIKLVPPAKVYFTRLSLLLSSFNFRGLLFGFFTFLTIVLTVLTIRFYKSSKTWQANFNKKDRELKMKISELKTVTSEDQFVKNKKLEEEIKNINSAFKKAIPVYELLSDYKTQVKTTPIEDGLFADALDLLSERNYASAEAEISSLSAKIKASQEKLLTSTPTTIGTNLAINNSPPNSGFSRRKVHTDAGDFVIDIISADLGSTRVVVDTASDETCSNNCPALALGDYVSRSGAFAGVNGSYFCPADYPSCAGKTNSFDLLAMNKNKHYLNSENNVYSTNPAVIFGNGWIRFVGAAQEWGRDTSVDGVLSNFPLLVSGHNVVFGGNSDPKQGSKGNRSFVASNGNTVYIGVAYNVTVAESALVLKTMNMDFALNLDSGGSTALWFGGYKAGPGRNIPNAILFIRK